MKHITVSIINYNGQQITDACLESLEKQDTSGFTLSVVVIDNASKEPYVQKKKEYTNFTLTVLFSKKNTGFSGGHNIGIQKAREQNADYILILNNDTVLDSVLIRELFVGIEKSEKRGITAPKIYFAKGHEYHKERYSEEELGKVFWYAGGNIDWKNVLLSHRGVDEVDHGQYEQEMATDFASGCCMLLRTSVLDQVGGFDERYFLYLEDSDLNERVKRAGFQVIYTPKARLWHINAASAGGSGSVLQDYFISRNRLLFGNSYAPARARIALIRESFFLLKNGRPMQKRGVADYYLRKFGKGSYH